MVSMGKPKVAPAKPRSLAKGLFAGCIGGLAGVLAKTLAERMFPPQGHAGLLPEPALEVAAADALLPAGKAVEGIRWGFGAVAGAAYGALVEYVPVAASKDGASLGLALGVLTRETTLSALGRSAKPKDTDAVTPLVVYGLTTEFVRKWVRKVL